MTTRVFYATDVHGSEKCFRKFLNAGKFYKANVLILGGDTTGKMVVPIVEQPDGTFVSDFLGRKHVAKKREEIEELERLIQTSGYYPTRVTPGEMEGLSAGPERVSKLFSKLMRERLRDWVALAEERLKGTGIKMYVTGGNDDLIEVDEILKSSKTDYVIDPEDVVEYIDEHHEMISSGFSNITPWRCPRDISEEELAERIEAMASQVKNMKNCIFNLHCPPYDSQIDTAQELDSEFRPVIVRGQPSVIAVGSTTVRSAIEKHQPLLGLHGHIHESRGAFKIGRTLCLNPGSEYSEGILRGVIVDLHEKGFKDYLFTSG